MAWRTVFCRTVGAQILENAAGCVWPSGCNSRRVAALPAPASLLARLFPLCEKCGLAPGTASRLPAEATPRAAGTAAAGQFPGLLAGLVGAGGAVEGEVRASAPEGAPAPGLETPAGIETLLGGTHTPQHTKAAASKPARPRTMEPEAEPDRDPELTAAGRTIPAVTLQAALAALAAGPNLPVPKEIGPMSAGNGEATPAPAPGQPCSVAPQPAADLPAAPQKTPAIQLQAGLALAEPGVAPGVREGQTATAAVPPAAAHPADWRGPEVSVAAGRNLPPPVESLPLSGQDGEPARQSAVPSPEQPSSHALPPGGPVPALPPGRPVPAVAVGVAGVEWAMSAEPAGPPQSWHPTIRQGGQTSAVATEAPPAEAAVDGEPPTLPQGVGGAPEASAEFPPAAVGAPVAEKASASASPAARPAQRGARLADGLSLSSLLKIPPAATAVRTGDAPSNVKEQGAQAPAPGRSSVGSPVGTDAKPYAEIGRAHV